MGEPPVIYGTDYSTPDGTCIRDYVDVRDVARAHLAVANFNGQLPFAMNVGTGRGASVREIINQICAVTGQVDIVSSEVSRRAGDSSYLCADVSLIKNLIGFSANYSLKASAQSLF